MRSIRKATHGNAAVRSPSCAGRTATSPSPALERRGLLHCVLSIPQTGQELHAICVHLGLRESHRRRQLGLLCHQINHIVPADAPLLVAGDFNDWRLRADDALSGCAGLREVFVESEGMPARTFLRAGRCCGWTASTCATCASIAPRRWPCGRGPTCPTTLHWQRN